VESIRKIRQAYHRDKRPIRQIAREFHVSKNTFKRIIRSGIIEQVYKREEQPRPKLSQYESRLKELFAEDSRKPNRHRRSAQLLFEQLQLEGFTGGYDSVRRYINQQSDKADRSVEVYSAPQKLDRWLRCKIAAEFWGETNAKTAEAVRRSDQSKSCTGSHKRTADDQRDRLCLRSPPEPSYPVEEAGNGTVAGDIFQWKSPGGFGR
jgi:hypothetical protein